MSIQIDSPLAGSEVDSILEPTVGGWTRIDTDGQVGYQYGRDVHAPANGHGYAVTRYTLEQSQGGGTWVADSEYVCTHLDVDRLRSLATTDRPLASLVDPATVPDDVVMAGPPTPPREDLADGHKLPLVNFTAHLDTTIPTPDTIEATVRGIEGWRLVDSRGPRFEWRSTGDSDAEPFDRVVLTNWGLTGHVETDDTGAGRRPLPAPYHVAPNARRSGDASHTSFPTRRSAFRAVEWTLRSARSLR